MNRNGVDIGTSISTRPWANHRSDTLTQQSYEYIKSNLACAILFIIGFRRAGIENWVKYAILWVRMSLWLCLFASENQAFLAINALSGPGRDRSRGRRARGKNEGGRSDNSVLACVASVSSRVIARKLEPAQKKWLGEGEGEEETLARKPHDSGKCPLIFHGWVYL